MGELLFHLTTSPDTSHQSHVGLRLEILLSQIWIDPTLVVEHCPILVIDREQDILRICHSHGLVQGISDRRHSKPCNDPRGGAINCQARHSVHTPIGVLHLLENALRVIPRLLHRGHIVATRNQ